MKTINVYTANSPCTSLKTIHNNMEFLFPGIFRKTDLKASEHLIIALKAISIFSSLIFSC